MTLRRSACSAVVVFPVVTHSEYVEALESEVKEKEAFEVLRNLQTEAKLVVS